MSEKNLNFDQPVERRGTHSLKYDFAEERGRKKDILPLWVADMDFKTSSFVQEALIRQAEHGIYGYTESDQEYYDAVSSGWNAVTDGRSTRSGSQRLRELSLHWQWR